MLRSVQSLSFICVLFLQASCVSLERRPSTLAVAAAPIATAAPTSATSASIEEEKSLYRAPQVQMETIKESEPVAAHSPTIQIDLNSKVQKWITYFTERDRERFQRFLNRGQSYREVVENVLDENDLPAELFYLAMIESGFRTDARSHASAVGVWQFIRGTGDRYGLRIDQLVDERRDPVRATEAAARYLRDLYNVFGSWHLAMAAYNAGEIRILRAIFKGRSRNFWELVEAKVLPSETAEYVPKFLAVVLIGKEPEKYGFTIARDNPYPNLKAVEVPGGVTLAQVAHATGVNKAVLAKVNPHLVRGVVPQNYEIWAPYESASAISASVARLSKLPTGSRRLASSSLAERTRFHRVKRGENLSTIARKYRLTVGHLKRINKLRTDIVHANAKLRIQASEYVASERVRYKVRRGDNLTIIARKFSTSVRKLKTNNNLSRGQIRVGQILNIDR